MKWSSFIFLNCIAFFFSVSLAKADVLLDLGGAYSSDTLKTSSDSGNTQSFYNANLLFSLDRRAQWSFGWIFFGISQTSVASSVTTTYSSADLGPAIRWDIDKGGMFSTTLAYGYLAKGKYTSGSTSEDWSGTSYFGQFAVQIPIRDNKFYIGASLNYYGATYSQKTVNRVESSNSAQKTWIFPMLSFTWRP